MARWSDGRTAKSCGRKAAGDKLLAAAHEFWTACRNEGQLGAVQWLTGSNGELVVFTRGEYRETIMNNIDSLRGRGEVHRFAGEEISNDEENRDDEDWFFHPND